MGVDKEKSEEQVLRSEGGDDVERGGWVEVDERKEKKMQKVHQQCWFAREGFGIYSMYIRKNAPTRGSLLI